MAVYEQNVTKILASDEILSTKIYADYTILYPTKIFKSFFFYYYFGRVTEISAGLYYCRLVLYRLTFLPTIFVPSFFIDYGSRRRYFSTDLFGFR